MKLQAAIKKIKNRAKVVGLDVDIQEHKRSHDSLFSIRFENSNQVISFYNQRNGADDVNLIKVTRDGDYSDPQSDYFAGSFVDNITQALNWVAPLPAKYPVGSLVRFKGNKRNDRARLAGKIGLVIEAQSGGTYKINVIENRSSPRYDPYYSERDLEKVS